MITARKGDNIIISTHSLTRRLTWGSGRVPVGVSTFQLTASQGGWRSMPITIFDIVLFQLTASQGGWRLWSFTMDYKCKNFNSQPHKEADGAQGMSGLLAIVFQLTASQGGWLSHAYQQTFANTFQLTASQGGWRLFLLLFSPAYRISTHSLTRRLTYFRYCIGNIRTYFNSQPHKEADSNFIQ